MASLDPCDVVGELPAIVHQEAESRPAGLANVVVRDIAGEVDQWWPRRGVENAAVIRGSAGPQPLRPLGAGCEMTASHEPAVVRHSGVVQQVIADDPVELLVCVMGG